MMREPKETIDWQWQLELYYAFLPQFFLCLVQLLSSFLELKLSVAHEQDKQPPKQERIKKKRKSKLVLLSMIKSIHDNQNNIKSNLPQQKLSLVIKI